MVVPRGSGGRAGFTTQSDFQDGDLFDLVEDMAPPKEVVEDAKVEEGADGEGGEALVVEVVTLAAGGVERAVV